MGFDQVKLTEFAKAAITEFAKGHQNETFYGFAIDASMLCLNSEECAAQTLKKYQDDWDRRTRPLVSISEMSDQVMKNEDFLLRMAVKHEGLDRLNKQACLAVINKARDRRQSEGCPHHTVAAIQELRANTGDWAYQGFAEFDEDHGFDRDLYSEHYDTAAQSDGGRAPDTEYAKAMTALVEVLQKEKAFSPLKCSPDFTATWVDHNY